MAPSLGVLTDKATSYAENIGLCGAQATGAFIGVIQGLLFVSSTLLSQLSTPDGRKQIIYGRQGPNKGGSTRDTLESSSQALGSAVDKLSNATAGVASHARSTVEKGADYVSRTAHSSTHSSSSSSTNGGAPLPVSNQADPAASPTKPPLVLATTHEAAALGPGVALPPITEGRGTANSKAVHEDLQKGTKTTKRAAATAKGNGKAVA